MIADDDTQAGRVYDAEREAWDIDHPRLLALEDLRNRAIRTTQAEWWFSRYGSCGHDLKVRSFPLHCVDDAQCVEGRTLYFHPRARTEFVLAHELSHIPLVVGPDHGPGFCRVYLDVTRYTVGVMAFQLLSASFKRHKVEVAKRSAALLNQPVISEEPAA